MSSVAKFVVASPNIADLCDADINMLIDTRVFGADVCCTGHLEYHYVSTGGHNVAGTTYWQCDECGAIPRIAATSKPTKHIRAIPDYCADMGQAWRIHAKISASNGEAQVRFELAMMSLYRCNVLRLEPRHIAMAALQAVGVADMRGFLIASKEGQ